jgi:hypothetical protein
MNRPSEIGLSHHYKVPPIYNPQKASTPVGPNHNFEVGPGAGRMVMRAGSQSSTPKPTPMGGPQRSLFK